MSKQTNREKAEKAKQRANDNSTREFDIVPVLCPACNEPIADGGDPDPNLFIRDEDDGEYGNDRAAYEYSPQKIVEHGDAETAWDAVHIVPVQREYDDGEKLQVKVWRHDYSTEGYQAWKDELDELKKHDRREKENQGLGEFS